VPPVVDDEPAFVPLRREVARELPQSPPVHVVEMDIADLPAALLLDVHPLLAHPRRVADGPVVGDRLDDDAPRALGLRRLAHRQLGLPAGAPGEAAKVVLSFHEGLALYR